MPMGLVCTLAEFRGNFEFFTVNELRPLPPASLGVHCPKNTTVSHVSACLTWLTAEVPPHLDFCVTFAKRQVTANSARLKVRNIRQKASYAILVKVIMSLYQASYFSTKLI